MKKLFLIFLLLGSLNLMSQECPEYCNKRTRYKFKLLKKEGLKIDTTKVRVDGVYILESELNGQKRYQFIRFFKNGRVYFSCPYCRPPSNDELNNLKYGNYGYYVVNNGGIKAETFEPYPRYFFVFYIIKGEQIYSNGSCKRGWPEIENKEYTQIKTVYSLKKTTLTSQSFW
jgi:hypothetical protein